MRVVATDAPLDARDLGRPAARAVFGLGRTGSSFSNGSGDYAIAFSTSSTVRRRCGETAPRARRSCLDALRERALRGAAALRHRRLQPDRIDELVFNDDLAHRLGAECLPKLEEQPLADLFALGNGR